MDTLSQRLWAEIELSNLKYNYRAIENLVGESRVMCVIKADAYGHGAPQTAKVLEKAGAKAFAVSTTQEALQLRHHGISGEILLLGIVPADNIPELNAQNITIIVADLETAYKYASVLKGKRQKINIKINTGMARLGINIDKTVEDVEKIAEMPEFEIDGIFTHFAVADEPLEDEFTKKQISDFKTVINNLEARGIKIPVVHAANSAGTIAYPESWMDQVRPGLVLYGYNPCKEIDFKLEPVMGLYANIVQLRKIKAGTSVGYGRTWRADKESIIAVVGAGYADGIHRALSDRMSALVRGKRVKQVGRICMDMLMLDVTNVEGVECGDIVTLIGRDGAEIITADEIAELMGTIPYEVLCAVGRRVPRIYKENGEIKESLCYIDKL